MLNPNLDRAALAAKFREFRSKLLDSASKCVGFFYGGHLMAHKLDDTDDKKMQYLTRHRDENTNEQRRFAYVLAFSKNWHPDWGGLLQFFEDDGTPRDAWAPKFNSMSLFDVRHVHSVTFLAPFTLEPRLSLTGWFRAKER